MEASRRLTRTRFSRSSCPDGGREKSTADQSARGRIMSPIAWRFGVLHEGQVRRGRHRDSSCGPRPGSASLAGASQALPRPAQGGNSPTLQPRRWRDRARARERACFSWACAQRVPSRAKVSNEGRVASSARSKSLCWSSMLTKLGICLLFSKPVSSRALRLPQTERSRRALRFTAFPTPRPTRPSYCPFSPITWRPTTR